MEGMGEHGSFWIKKEELDSGRLARAKHYSNGVRHGLEQPELALYTAAEKGH